MFFFRDSQCDLNKIPKVGLYSRREGKWGIDATLKTDFFFFILTEQRKPYSQPHIHCMSPALGAFNFLVHALQHWTLTRTEKHNANFSSTMKQNFFTFLFFFIG